MKETLAELKADQITCRLLVRKFHEEYQRVSRRIINREKKMREGSKR